MFRLIREKLQIRIGAFLKILKDQNMASSSLFTVRSLPDNDRLSMEFDYSHNGASTKQFRMERLKEEELGQTLSRLKNSISSKFMKRKRKKNEAEMEQEDIHLNFTINGAHFDTESKVCISEALKHGSEVSINEQKYQVSVNPPTVLKIDLPKSMMSGFPVFPLVELQFANLSDSDYKWKSVHKDFHNLKSSQQNESRKFLSNDRLYTPTNDDIDCKIELSCIPKLGDRSGFESTVISKVEVEAGPGICPFETRHMYTAELTDATSCRVMSYNILADAFADTEFTRNELYPYCAPYALSIDYRKQLLLKEILGYNADIICLQEVDQKIFDRYLLPAMEINGFSGMYQMKSGKIREGEAMFYRMSKFKLAEEHNIDITQSLEEEGYTDIQEKVAEHEILYEFYKKRKNVLQVCVLESRTDPHKALCVANTHLFFHKDFEHIRLLQGAVSIRHLEKVMKRYREKGINISLVFCGDFNANPKSPLHGFLSKSQISPEEYDLEIKETGKKVTNFDFGHSFKLTSACGYPRYTNYVGSFHGQLDYVFVDDSLEVVNVVPPPDHELVTQHLALPSVVFPSDHIAQICDVRWK